MPHDVFYKLHPFHLLVDEDLNVMQAGAGARRVAAGLAPGDRFVQHFKARTRAARAGPCRRAPLLVGATARGCCSVSLAACRGLVCIVDPQPAGARAA